MVKQYVFFRSYSKEYYLALAVPHKDIEYAPLKYNILAETPFMYSLQGTSISFGTNAKGLLKNVTTRRF